MLASTVRPGTALPADLDPERLGADRRQPRRERVEVRDVTRRGVAAQHSATDEVAVVVTDDGPGIPSDKLGAVFERLYTVRETPGRAVGTGLGLAIVRELAAAMGGRSWAEAGPRAAADSSSPSRPTSRPIDYVAMRGRRARCARRSERTSLRSPATGRRPR